MKNKLIYTTFRYREDDYAEYNDLLLEWLISLRTLGKYDGQVIVFDYSGGTISCRMDITRFGRLSVIPLDPVPPHQISNRRNVDVIPYLRYYPDHAIAHFDADVWFQDDINPMFDEIEKTEGAYLGVEPRRSCNFRNGPPELEELHCANQRKIGGFVFGGWYAGKQKPFIERLTAIKKLYDDKKWDIEMHGTDQSLFQTLIDFSKDRLDGSKWAASHYLCEFKEGKWYLGKDVAPGFHLVAFGRSRGDSLESMEEHYRFKYLHKGIYKSWKNLL
jgi:hypothetical protein